MDSFKFTTPVSIPKSNVSVSHQQHLLLIGSCFAENIGEKLIDNKFNVVVNPNGIIYNPISVINGLQRIINNQVYTEKEIFKFNDKWISFNHHGCFSSFDKTDCLKQINTSLAEAHQQLEKCTTIFVTFGSAWVYEYPDVGIVVNCHKIPNKEFKKRLLSVKEILSAFNAIKKNLKDLNVVFTVSPVRHIKDGLHENNLSKSVLHLAINSITEQNENCHYFPAYELIIDELRDYRFYKEDMVHPTEIAINYVWEKFIATHCDKNTTQLVETITKIKQAVNHKPFNFESAAHQKFIKQQIQLMDEVTTQYPFINFEKEKEVLQRNK